MAPDAIDWREWDGEIVVRNERTGSTHLLGPLAGRVLQVLLEAEDSLSGEDIAVRLGEEPDTTASADCGGAIVGVLSEFRHLLLAEPEGQ